MIRGFHFVKFESVSVVSGEHCCLNNANKKPVSRFEFGFECKSLSKWFVQEKKRQKAWTDDSARRVHKSGAKTQ